MKKSGQSKVFHGESFREVPLLVEAENLKWRQPTLKHSLSQKRLKDEDIAFAAENLTLPGNSASEQPPWYLFCICDGHTGSSAALYVKNRAWDLLKDLLPRDPPPEQECKDCIQWAEKVRKAVVKAFQQLEREFLEFADPAGTTVTMALVCGFILTVANVGDSDALLDTIMDTINISATHRIDDCLEERERLQKNGVHLARLSPDLSGPCPQDAHGIGPIRCWPGGLAMARSIGDAEAGEHVVPVPHIHQVIVPAQGARLLIASDGLWDCMDHKRAVEVVRHSPCGSTASRLVTSAVFQNGWCFSDDTTVMVIDIQPPHADEFHKTAKRYAKSKGGSGALLSCLCGGKVAESEEAVELMLEDVKVIANIDGMDVIKMLDDEGAEDPPSQIDSCQAEREDSAQFMNPLSLRLDVGLVPSKAVEMSDMSHACKKEICDCETALLRCDSAQDERCN